MPPTRGGNGADLTGTVLDKVSIHAPHAGGQHHICNILGKVTMFQYMPPTRGGNAKTLADQYKPGMFQYMPPTRGGNARAH